jgi:hypothetical protein
MMTRANESHLKYLEYLASIGRKTSDDMTDFEKSKLSSLLMQQSCSAHSWRYSIVDRDFISSAERYLETQDDSDLKNLAEQLRKNAVLFNRASMDDLLANQVKSSKEAEVYENIIDS